MIPINDNPLLERPDQTDADGDFGHDNAYRIRTIRFFGKKKMFLKYCLLAFLLIVHFQNFRKHFGTQWSYIIRK